MGEKNRIAYAWWLAGWDHEGGDRIELKRRAQQVTPAEYERTMENEIYCPGCFTPLFRSPKEKPMFSNGRSARFNHYAAFSDIECGLRAPKVEGISFDNEELAKQAIADGILHVVHSFRSNAPEAAAGGGGGGAVVAFVDDHDGPKSNYAISRHKGENFELPTKITTVGAICRNFDENLYSYYLLPSRKNAVLLSAELKNIAEVETIDETPRLYFGKILRSFNAGRTPQNLRMTKLQCHPNIADFYIKAIDGEQTSKGINDDSAGRIVLFWGRIVENGIGLGLDRPGWGEYALLPEKYERFLA